MNRLGTLLFSILFTSIGAAAMYGAWLLYDSQQRVREAGSRADGVIVALKEKKDSKGRVSYAPVVRFTDAKGRVVDFVSSVSYAKIFTSVGREVSVVYDPVRPQNADVDSLLSRWLGPAILSVIGAVFLWAGLHRKKPASPGEREQTQ